RLPLTFSIIALSFFSYSQQIKPGSRLIVKNPLIHQIIPENAVVEILADGFNWTEGPLWLPTENKLIFSDIPSNSIFEWTENAGKKLYLKPSGFTGKEKREGEPGSNGLLLNASGELVMCQHGDRRVAKMDAPLSNPKAEFITLADNYNGKKLNSPNDAAYHKNGDLYFTDPPYGLEKNVNDPAKELDFQGVFKLEKTGEVVLLTKELSRPNGIAFSPDFSKLYVANSDPKRAIWMVYDLDEGGSLKNGKLFFDATEMTGTLKGLPDGLKVHPNGWVFATGPGGVLVFTSQGEHLGTIFTGEATANCAFNADFSELFLTADDYLLRVKLK
ncbi:MAG: SMP-30/gluconolactonase/LRE family protein, partial [Bacteroidales bacterium]|nr:SMP-30/gluconolactonase/LRE family protein [Bacteroidales bacterium]